MHNMSRDAFLRHHHSRDHRPTLGYLRFGMRVLADVFLAEPDRLLARTLSAVSEAFFSGDSREVFALPNMRSQPCENLSVDPVCTV
ncbi:MAG: hypothetical protein KatS3mg113_0068 [Planctomycetaceae bacterium]|nr:MAG: hypothetical protein KatS3mg113_0068 [Planctomycetaceae bacterium]